LPQLRHAPRSKHLRELRLARKNEVHQLHARCLEIRKHPHNFKDCLIEILRFVNDDNEALTSAEFGQQHFIQLLVHSHKVVAAIVNA
jgi:hypothetical protein